MFSHVCWHRRPGEIQHSFTSAGETMSSRQSGQPEGKWSRNRGSRGKGCRGKKDKRLEQRGRGGLKADNQKVQARKLKGHRGQALFSGNPRPQHPLPMQVLPNASLWKPGLQSQR